MILYEPYHLWASLCAGALGLCFGSFVNVVTYRLPIMKRLGQYSDGEKLKELREQGHFNLAVPSSACPQCGTSIKPWFNIPLFGWLALRGKCFSCKGKIPVEYPAVELLFGFVFFAIVFTDGVTPTTAVRCLMVLLVFCAARIYRDTQQVYKPLIAAAGVTLIMQIVLGGLGYAYSP